MNESIQTPVRTATPERAMKPTPAEIENGMPRTASAATPPVSARGTPVTTMAASRQDSNRVYSTPKLLSSTSGKPIERRVADENGRVPSWRRGWNQEENTRGHVPAKKK